MGRINVGNEGYQNETDGAAHGLAHDLDSGTGLPVAGKSTGQAKNVYIAGTAFPAVALFNAQIFSNTTNGSYNIITDLVDYADWGFQVTATPSDGVLLVQFSDDSGATFYTPTFMEVNTGAIIAPGSTLPVGKYVPVYQSQAAMAVYANAAYQRMYPVRISAIKVSKTGALLGTVIAIGGL